MRGRSLHFWSAVAVAGLLVPGPAPWASAATSARPGPRSPAVMCIGTRCPVEETVNFDNGAVGTGQVITDQYEGDGVDFVDPVGYGFREGEAQVGQNFVQACSGLSLFAPQGGLTASPPDAGLFGSCGPLEFPDHGTFGIFTSGVSSITTDLGEVSASGGFYFLWAYNFDHDLIGYTSVRANQQGLVNPLTYSAPSGDLVWAFAISAGNGTAQDDFGVGSLTFYIPRDQAPAVGLSASGGIYGVVPSSGSVAVTLHRYNGSTGEVDLSVSGLPSGVSATFSPAALGGTSTTSTLDWSIGPSAGSGDSTFTLSATPAVPAAGAAPAPPLSVGLTVSLPYSWRPGLLPMTVADCQTVTDYNGGAGIFYGPSSISGSGTFSVSGAGPGTGLQSATLTPSTFSDSSAEPVLSVSAGPTTPVTDTTLTLSAAAPGYATETTTVVVDRILGEVSSWSVISGSSGDPDVLDAPSFGRYSETLQVVGEGFCPGTKVAFGDYGDPPSVNSSSPALVTPSYISPDGTQMDVVVPHYAAAGPVDVFTPGGSFESNRAVTIANGYAATDGYNFANKAGPNVGLSDLADVFPQDEVYVQVDPCSGLSFGIVHCSLGSTPIGTPQADIFLDSGGSSVAQGGQCYGFSATSIELQDLPGAPGGPGPASFGGSASDVNQISDNGSIDNYILGLQISQDSSEVLSLRASAQAQAENDSAAQLESQLRADLVSPDGYADPVIVDMFATVNGQRSGHSVVAYDVQDTGGGNFDIYVYNPNNPYNASVSGDSANATANWVANQANSIIHVQANGNWSFPQLGYTGTLSTGNLYMIPADSLPSHFDLPGSFSFGNILASAPPSTTLDQVTDAAGHTLLGPGGAVNTSATGIAGARLLYTIAGTGEPTAPLALLPPGGSYSLTLSPAQGRTGPVAGGLIGHSVSASLSGTASSRVSFGLDDKTGTLSIRPGTGALSANLALTPNGGADRTATLSLAPGSTGTLSAELTPTGSLRLSDNGGSARLSVELGSFPPGKVPGAFRSPLLRAGPGTSLVLRPSSWANLSTSAVTVQTAEHGKVTSRVLHGGLGALRVSSLELSVHRSGRLALLGLSASWESGGNLGKGHRAVSASAIWVVLQGSHVVAHRSVVLSSSSSSKVSASWAFSLKGLHGGKYRVVGAVVVSAAPAGAGTGAGASKATTSTLVVG